MTIVTRKFDRVEESYETAEVPDSVKFLKIRQDKPESVHASRSGLTNSLKSALPAAQSPDFRTLRSPSHVEPPVGLCRNSSSLCTGIVGFQKDSFANRFALLQAFSPLTRLKKIRASKKIPLDQICAFALCQCEIVYIYLYKLFRSAASSLLPSRAR